MTPRQDPYRTLGLVPGATAGEIRSAYRRLAKLNHPDTAGERSLPRFLAIKAAYEELVDGEGRLRSRAWPGRDGGAGAGRPSGSPASRASREAWRARRAAGATGASGAGGGASPGGSGANSGNSGSGANHRKHGPDERNARPGSTTGSGPRASRGAKAGTAPRGGGHARTTERRTARPGSTTYDDAAQPLDPSWEGGSWYGASSGSYWTLNPREYADPRKHGPEYQERARRAAQLEAARRSGSPLPTDPEVVDAASSTWAPPPPPPSESEPNPPDPLPRYRRPARRPSAPDAP